MILINKKASNHCSKLSTNGMTKLMTFQLHLTFIIPYYCVTLGLTSSTLQYKTNACMSHQMADILPGTCSCNFISIMCFRVSIRLNQLATADKKIKQTSCAVQEQKA